MDCKSFGRAFDLIRRIERELSQSPVEAFALALAERQVAKTRAPIGQGFVQRAVERYRDHYRKLADRAIRAVWAAAAERCVGRPSLRKQLAALNADELAVVYWGSMHRTRQMWEAGGGRRGRPRRRRR